MDTISHRGPLLWRSGGPGLRDDIRPSGRSFLLVVFAGMMGLPLFLKGGDGK